MNFEDIKQKAQKYLVNSYAPFEFCAVSGKNATLCGIDGREYIDFTSGIGVNSLGAANEGWAEAVSKQASTLQHISNLYYNPTTVLLAEKLCNASGFEKAFFCNSGAEANECAIKIARKYSFDKYGDGRNEIITLKNSFHGRTVTTLSATGQDAFHNFFFPFTEGFKFVTANDCEELKNAIDDRTCAVMIELVQGEGGLIPLQSDYVRFVRDICSEKDVIMIADEVQTGVGRTGKLYAFENFSIRPDMITSSKGLGGGLPIGACLVSEKLGDVIMPGQHGTTFGGNPVCCAAALEVISKVSEKEFLEEVSKKAQYFKQKLQGFDELQNIRGLGLMIGADVKDAAASDVVKLAVKNGLLMLTAKTSLRFLPPLTITYEEIDLGMEILGKVFKTISEGK